MILAILIHNRQPLDPRRAWTRFRNIDNAGIKIAIFPRDTLVNRVGDDVGNTPPVLWRGFIGQPRHLALAENIPQAEFHTELAIAQRFNLADDKRLAVQHAPIAKAWLHLQAGNILHERSRINNAEQAGAGEVVIDHLHNIAAHFSSLRCPAREIRNRNGDGFDRAAININPQFSVGALQAEAENSAQDEKKLGELADHRTILSTAAWLWLKAIAHLGGRS